MIPKGYKELQRDVAKIKRQCCCNGSVENLVVCETLIEMTYTGEGPVDYYAQYTPGPIYSGPGGWYSTPVDLDANPIDIVLPFEGPGTKIFALPCNVQDLAFIGVSSLELITYIELQNTTSMRNLTIDGLENLISFSAPLLTEVTGNIYIENNDLLETISMPVLTTSGALQINNNVSLLSISADVLAGIDNSAFMSGNTLLPEISLPSLVSTGNFVINPSDSLVTLNLPLLATTSQFGVLGSASIVSLSVPSLVTATEIDIRGNSSLTSLSLPLLSNTITNTINLSNNALTNASVSQILIDFISNGMTNEAINLQNQGHVVTLTFSGTLAENALIADGNTIARN